MRTGLPTKDQFTRRDGLVDRHIYKTHHSAVFAEW